MAGAIMIQGTMSSVGKSLITAGLCRVFRQDGYRVVPFKSQNMALNSYITEEGFEMGRAQAVQAEAAGVKPDVRMNPILLKPTSESGSQVILMGRPVGNMKAGEYFGRKREYIPLIREAYEALAKENDIVVIEGAGSPAEINLKENDIVNMGMAELADAPVLLVGDIDRGGVFAQLLGTIELLEQKERDRICGLIINKFRGDKALLEPGLRMIEDRCGKSVIGVVPYTEVRLEDEDSLSDGLLKRGRAAALDIAVIRLKWISNFTDVDAFDMDEDVSVRYVDRPDKLGEPDMVIIPGSKNTIADMKLLRKSGMEACIRKLADKGVIIFGICGGYQIMGRSIDDGAGTEGGGSIAGMGLLPVDTVFDVKKTTVQVRGKTLRLNPLFEDLSDKEINGYEIHMGQCRYIEQVPEYLTQVDITSGGDMNAQSEIRYEGCVKDNCIGTYIHGIFDDIQFRESLIGLLLRRKGLNRRAGKRISYDEFKNEQYDMLAKILRDNLDMEKIYSVLKIRQKIHD